MIARRDVDAGERLASAIELGGGSAIAVRCDVTADASCRSLASAVADRFGRVDTVFANQGVGGERTTLTAWSDEAIDACLDVNLLGCVRLARAFEAGLAADGGGRFVVTGSKTGHEAGAGVGMYAISKAAVAQMVRQLAVEWRSHPIAVNELIPGPVRTEMTGYRADRGDQEPPIEHFARSRGEWLKDPDDVAPLARFLAGLPPDGPTGQVFSLAGRPR